MPTLRHLTMSIGNTTTPLGYAGQYTDPQTGLVYLRARYYDPQTGQFISRDPLEAITQQPYSYTNDNPLNETDPLGLDGFLGTGIGPNIGPNILPTPGQVVSAAGSVASTVGTFVGNHYGQIAEGAAAAACLTEVVPVVGCLALTGGAFATSTYQTVTDSCLSSGQKVAGVLLDGLGTVPGAQAAGLEAGGLLEDGLGKTALDTLGGVVGGSAIVGGSSIVSAAGPGSGQCGCS